MPEFNNLSTITYKFKLSRTPELEYKIQQVTLPAISLGSADVPSPFTVIPTPGNIKYEDLTISFMVGETMKDYREIFEWMADLGQPRQLGSFPQKVKDAYSDISLIILNSSYNPVIQFTFVDAFPVFLSPISFDITETGVPYAHATSTFRCLRIEMADIT